MMKSATAGVIALGFTSVAALAGDAKLTIYDDGLSCPAACDSHVVFHPSLNGTNHAHLPTDDTVKCISGSECEICFTHSSDQCITVVYRGAGPGEHTFDFTPAFYVGWCEKNELPEMLQEQCASLKRAAASLNGRVNCIANPGQAPCADLMEMAKDRKDSDRPKYEECRRLGQSAYNDDKPRSQQRVIGCAYEAEEKGGPNSNGLTWHKLLPGSCRDGTYIGRDGLDCCSGIPLADGPLGRECRIYYPELPDGA